MDDKKNEDYDLNSIPAEDGGDTLRLASICPQEIPHSIIFHRLDCPDIEVLRFTKDRMYVKGVETDCPQDIIHGMREWLTGQEWFINKEKARKYDAIVSLINKEIII